MMYLASPYSDPDPVIRKTRFLIAAERTAEKLTAGLIVYSPIVHCHFLVENFNLPPDFDFWKKYNFGILRRASSVCVLQIKGWEESKGVRAEMQLAADLDIPLVFEQYP